jgi:hypothetical protein
MLKQLLSLRSDAQSVTALCVVQRFQTKSITDADQLLSMVIPDYESEITNDMAWAFLTPALIRRQDQVGVGGVLLLQVPFGCYSSFA